MTFAPGSATATLTIAPGDDDRFFVYRQLNVRLRTGAAGLFRLRLPASDAASDLSDATRTDYHLPVVENDPIRIAVAPRDEYVYEDEQACFTFSHNVVPHDFHFLDDPVAFTATFSQQGDFLAETPADRTVTVRADSPTHPLCLELADDETTEAAGSVTVAIVADAGANIVADEGRGSATVRLLDNERPLVTLSANGADTVTEGGRAGFKLSLSAPTVVPFTVKYRLETDGDYGFEASDEGVWLYSFGPGAEEFVRQVSTRNDDVDEPDGSVTVTLLDEYEYDLDPDGPARIVLTVADDDVPAISMTAPDDPRIFDEGDEVTLTFTREGDLTASLTIPAGHLESSYDADVTPGATSHGAITFEASSATATLTVTVENDDFYYPGLRNLRFTLRHDDSGLFRLAAGAQTHDSVEVRDDDQDAITIGIEAVEAAVTEADQACFVINLEKAWFPPGFGPGIGYDVELSVTQDGAWLAPGTQTLHEEALYRAATPFCLDLEDDDRPEDAGSVTVAIVEFSKEGFAAADRPSATVAVADDDFVPTLVSLAAAASQLAEGAAAEFTLSRTIGSFGDGELPVDLRVTEVGDYLDRSGGLGAALDAAGNARVTFAAGAATAPFRLLTVDDDDAESEGSLTVELTAPGDDTDYTLHGATSATTTVRSEDLIEVSVAAVSTPVTEGEDAVFRFTRTGSAEGRLSVAVQVRGHKKVMSPASRALAEKTGPGPDLTVVFEDGVTEVTQTLTTEADRYNEGDGEIVLLVEDLLGTTELPYRIRGSESGAVLVRDDDIPEVELRWITPTARLEDDTWVGEIVEGSDIDVEVTCTGGTLSPPGVDGIDPKLRIIVEHEERLNHPINTHHDRRRLGIRYPCDQDAEVSYFESGSRRWTGPANGLILLELQPQRLSTNLTFTECYSDMIPFGWKSGNIEFCPKYTLGTATKARVAVLNRNPTITVEAVSDEVTEGELARFRLTRIWNAFNLSPVGGYTTTVEFTAAAEGDYVTDDLPAGPRTFDVPSTEIIIEVPTVDDNLIAPDGEVTLELLPQGAESSRVNVGASYEIYDQLEGITPPGKSSLRATVRIRNNDDERSIDIDDAAAAEHAGAVEFPVTLSGPDHLRTVSASWKTAAGSATAGRDYTASGGTVAFAPGETEATIRVPVANDALDEPDEDFTVTLFDPENGVFPGSDTVSATGTIHDNDLPAVSIRTSDAIAAQHDRVEEGEIIEFVLTRDGQTDKRLQASFTIQFDRSWPVTGFFGVGESTVTVSVTAPEDEILNSPSDRPAVATVTGQDGVYAVGDPASKTVTIYDDDREKAIFLGGFQSMHFTGVGNTPQSWFRYSVSNAGDGSTDGPVRVESEQFDTVACGDEALASGVANVYCSSPTYTVTQADVDAGEVTIRATATDGTTVSNELSFRMVYQPDQKLIFEERYGVKEGDDALALVVSLSAKIDEIVLMESDQTVQVDYQTTGPPREDQVAATPESDYEAVSGTLTFTPGQTTQTVSVPILTDELNEPKERFRVQFSNPRHAQLPRNSALVTIVDAPNPDNKPVVSIEPTREGPVYESAGFFDFDVVLSRTSGHVLTDVEIYMPGKGSAKPGRTAAEYESGDDYVALGARAVRFEPGQTRRTVSVPLYDDDVVEPDETFVIQLQLNETNRVSLHGTKSEATGTIVDDDASAIHLSVEPPAAVAEDGGARTMTVTAALDRGLPLPVAATVAVEVGGGGDAGRDFEAVAAFSVEIPAGEARGTATFELTPVADDVDEEDREVAVTGQVTAGPTNLPVTATSLTITDNDERGVTVTPTELTVNEGGTGAYTVVFTSAPTEPVTVAVETPSGTAVRVSPASLVFTADDWDDEQTVTVEAAADDDAAADEPVTLTHTVSGGDYGDDNVAADPVKVTIDEADMATLAIAAAGASEADGAVTFTVSLSAHGAEPVSVAYATADVTALAASDYTQTSGTLTFAADEFEKSIRVPLTDDALDEADAETFTLTLNSAMGAALTGGAAALTVSGTIEDDDARGIAVEPTHLDLAEGASGSYTVALASQPSADVTVALRVGGDADVTADASSLTFTAANWRQAQRVTVSAAADADAKDDVAAVVHTVSGGDYEANDVPAKPVVVEVDDDETPSTAVTLSVDPASLREDAGSTEVTVTAALDGGAPTEDTEVTVSVGSGTAIEGEDFAALADVTLTIGAGELSGAATFDLAPVNDDLDERPETVSVTGSAAGLSVTGAAVTITDDDVRGVTVSERSLDVAEGEERTYTVVLTSQPTGDVSVNLTVADDRPADRNDRSRASEPREDAAVAVTVQPEVLTFTAEDWRTPKTVTVRGAVDLDAEDDRARVVNRASGADYNRLPVGIVRVTVRDADAPALVAPASLTVMEGGSATYGVTLATRPAGPVTVTISGHAGTDLTVSPATLGFAVSNWNRKQDVRVTAAADADIADGEVTLGHAATGADYGGVSADVAVTVTDVTPTLSITEAAAAPEHAGNLVFEVQLSAPAGEDVTVGYATSDGTATAGEDYTAAAGDATLTIAAGQRTAAIAVPITNDSVDEVNETFTVTLRDPENAALARGRETATGTIADDDAATLSVADARVKEARGARVPFAVTLSAPSSRQVTVAYETAEGTAKAGEDYDAAEGTLTFAAGETGKTIEVFVRNDILDELDETFTLQLLEATNAALARGRETATGTIADNDDPPPLSVGGDNRVESAGSSTFRVGLGWPSSLEVTVNYATGPLQDAIQPSATEGVDYEGVQGTLTFAPGETRKDVPVTLIDDQLDEVDEHIGLLLSEARNATMTRSSRGNLLIYDNDDPNTKFSIAGARAGEDAGEMVFSVGLDNASGRDMTVEWETSDGTATEGRDYTAAEGTLTFAAGTTAAQEIRVAINDDTVDEAEEETFTVTLHNAEHANLFGGGTTLAATGTIVDDDDPVVTVAFDTDSHTATEDGDAATVRVRLSDDPERTVEIPLTRTPGTDVTDGDYSGVPESMIFASGETEKRFTVRATDDDVDEDDETVTLGFGTGLPDGVTPGSPGRATVTLRDNDTRGVTVSEKALEIDEGGTVSYTVKLNSEPTGEVRVAISGMADTDVSVNPESLTFPADDWDEEQTLTVSAAEDADALADAPVTLTHTVSGADYGDNNVTADPVAVTVVEKDAPTLSMSGVGADEDAGDMVFTVTLSTASSNEVTVAYATSNGTGAEAATAGSDYTQTQGTLTFPANSRTAQTIAVPINDDTVDEEEEETFTVTLSEAANANLAGGGETLTRTGTIVDNDDPAVTVAFDADSYTATEGGSDATVRVRLSGDPERTVEIELTHAPDDGDYSGVPESVTFNRGETEKTFTVRATDDAVDDDGETVTLGFGTGLPDGVTPGSRRTATVTLADDDARGVTVSRTELEIDEGATGSYTVKLNSEPTEDVTVTPSRSSGDEDVTVSEALTFTTSNWETPQTVTVEAAQDADAADDAATIANAVSGGDYGSVSAAVVRVTVDDNETESTTVTLSVSPQEVSESGGGQEVTVTGTLNGGTRGEATTVTVSVSPGSAASSDFGAVSDFPVTIPANQASGEATFTLTPEDDAIDEDDETVSVGGTTTASGLTVTGAEVTIRDDDDRGVTVSETELEIDEGGTGSYTVKLTSQPTGEVTVALGGASGDVSADTDPNRTGNQNTLTFTSGNWETAQTVTVAAAEDDDAVADDAVTLTHALSGGDYADVSADPVIVTVKENETPAAVLTLAFAEPDHDDRDNSGDVTLGDVLTYTATATNSGNVPLADVAVSDLLVNAGGVECAALGLGGECELTGDYTVTQADVDAGEVANTATAAATGVSARTASRTTIVAQQKALTLAKTATTVSFGSVGDRIAYSYEVTNSGTVTLSGTVAITDDKIASGITCPAVPAAGLGPGASLTCTGSYTAAQADVDASQVTNKATAMLDGVESNEATATVTRPQLAGEVPTVSVEAVSDTENAGHLKFAVSLNQASAQTVTVDYATSNGTATAGEDYTPTEGTLTFPANSTASRTIAVPITDDAVDEADEETFTVTLRDPVNATLSALATTATGTIADDDERGVSVSETTLEIDEGATGRYTVKLNSEPAGEVTVAAATATGSDADVQVSPARLRFTADNWDDAQTVTVSADEDADAADDAATIAHTGNGGDYRNVAGPTVDVTVADDETASTTVALSVEPQTVAEDAGTAGRSVTVTATLNQAPRALATEVTVAVAGGTATAGDDFTAVDAFAVTIAAGALRGSADFTLRPVDDDVAEAGETVTVSGTAPASSGLTVASAAVTITDDDERGVTVSEETLPVTEGGSGTYTVVLTSQPTADVTVTVSVPPGTDVSATPTSLTFTSEDWDEEQTVTVRAAEDDDAVADAPVTLTHAVSSTGDYGTNGVTADPVEVTIVEADTPTLSIADMRADEDAGGMVFTVTLSTAGSNEVTVQYATSNGTGPGAATAGEDYTQKTGSLTFAAGTTTAQEIRVPITDDDVDEADEETFALTLSNAQHAALAGGANTLAATGTIADDDDPPAAGIADAGASEGDGGITFTVSLETASARVVTVDWATAADAAAVNPATADADYTAANGTLAFPAQSTERTIRVLVVDDDAVEESETFKVELGNPRYAILGASAAAVGTITDDDVAPPPGDPPVPEDPPTPGGGPTHPCGGATHP